ncbi:hypothetical protein GCM10023238_25870 [Streptomyces heliomycini]
MGLGPISAIYQARFNRYLTSRGIKDVSDSHVWAFLGDGEMDEPESTTALTLASREQLDNLTFVINCNLQRLDGPVRANFKIVQELEAQFRGAGWNVIKTLWGTALGRAVPARHHRRPRTPPPRGAGRAGADVPDARRRLHPRGLLRQGPGARRDAKLLSDDKILECFHLSRGGHESRKVYAAYKAALAHKGAPTVILAQTVKGHTLGEGFASKNANHQMKKLTVDEFKAMRDRLELPISDAQFVDGQVPYVHPGADSPEVRYLQERRAALGVRPRPAVCTRWPRCPSPPTRRSPPSTRAPARRTWPPPWPSSAWSRTWSATRRPAGAGCRSSPTRRAPSAWRASSRPSASTRRWARRTSRSTATS